MTDSMKIVFLNPIATLGGAERLLLTMMAGLKTSAPNLQLHLVINVDGPLAQAAAALGVTVTVVPLPSQLSQVGDSGLKHQPFLIRWRSLIHLFLATPALLGYLHQFRAIIHSLAPTLIHSNGIKTHLLSVLAGFQGPIVWHIHDFYSTRPLVARLLKVLSQRATIGIAISQAVAQDAHQTMPSLPIELIYNAIAPHYLTSSCPPSCTSLPLRIGLAATFARWKGQDIFLQAAAIVLKTHTDLMFYLIGGAIYQTQGSQWSEQELKTLAIALGIEQQVEFLGFQSDMLAVYQQLDIVVHASTQPEPFGLVIAEAMACGKAVIAVQTGGAAELFTPDYDAIGIPPNDPVALANAMQRLVEQPDLRIRLGNHARAKAQQQFGYDRLAHQLLTCYHHCQLRRMTSI